MANNNMITFGVIAGDKSDLIDNIGGQSIVIRSGDAINSIIIGGKPYGNTNLSGGSALLDTKLPSNGCIQIQELRARMYGDGPFTTLSYMLGYVNGKKFEAGIQKEDNKNIILKANLTVKIRYIYSVDLTTSDGKSNKAGDQSNIGKNSLISGLELEVIELW